MAKRKEPCLLISKKWTLIADNLNNAELGELFRAVLFNFYRGDVYSSGNEKLYLQYISFASEALANMENYREKCRQNQLRAQKRWEKAHDASINAGSDEDAE